MKTTLSACLLACGILAAASAVPVAQGGRPMTIQDLIGAVRVADPRLSPDGRRVLYLRTTTDLEAGRRNADIWSVETDGGSPRALIEGDKSEHTARWSPDGRQIAFISNRDGSNQVYLADADGGNVRKVTDLAMGVQPPLVFSPDGQRLAFVSDVYPECPDEACNARRKADAAKNPVKVRRLTRLLYRHWDEWRENIRHHIFVVDLESRKAKDLTPGDFDAPPVQQEEAAVAFTPDGRHLAFVSNREGNDREAWSTNNDVWLVPSDGGEARRLTPNPAADVQPVFSRDGRTLFVRSQRRPGFESDRWYLEAHDLRTGARRTLFESPDLSVADFALSTDGASIYFTASQEAREHLWVVPAAGGTPTRVAQGGTITSPQPGSGFVVFTRSTLTSPPDIFRVPASGGEPRALTAANDDLLDEVAFPKPESHTVKGAGGTPIQYWLVKPPGFDPSRRYPVVFMIHGGPQGAWEDAWSTRWNPSLWAAQGWVVVAPNPRGSTGFGQPFVDAITGDWAGKVMVDLDAVFDEVASLPFTDASRMGIAGASYGGYAVNWIIGHTDRFAAAVTHDGVFNLESMALTTEELWFTEWEFGGAPWTSRAREAFLQASPHLHVHKVKTPTLIITNELDFRVPVDQGLQLFTALRRQGVEAEALVFPDEGHWVLGAENSRVWHEAVFGWLHKYLGSAAPKGAQ